MNRDLVIRSYQVDFAKDGATRKTMGIVLNVPNGITIGDSAGVKGSDVNRSLSWARELERMNMVLQRVLMCRLAAWRRTRYHADVVPGVPHFKVDPGWPGQLRKFG